MNEISKRKFSEELNKMAENFNKSIVNELRTSIKSICKYYQLSIQDLCKLCDIDSTIMEALMNDSCDSDCLYDLRTISLLTLMSNGRLNVLNDAPTAKELNEVNCIIKDYQDEKNPPKKEIHGWDKKVMEMLEMFGVKNLDDMDHLLNAIKSVRNAINEYDKYDQCDDKCECCKKDTPKSENKQECKHTYGPLYVDEKGNFHSQEPYVFHDKNADTPRYEKLEDENKVKGVVYDSETMDKPKEFEFSGSFDKIIPNILDFVSKKLF